MGLLFSTIYIQRCMYDIVCLYERHTYRYRLVLVSSEVPWKLSATELPPTNDNT